MPLDRRLHRRSVNGRFSLCCLPLLRAPTWALIKLMRAGFRKYSKEDSTDEDGLLGVKVIFCEFEARR